MSRSGADFYSTVWYGIERSEYLLIIARKVTECRISAPYECHGVVRFDKPHRHNPLRGFFLNLHTPGKQYLAGKCYAIFRCPGVCVSRVQICKKKGDLCGTHQLHEKQFKVDYSPNPFFSVLRIHPSMSSGKMQSRPGDLEKRNNPHPDYLP